MKTLTKITFLLTLFFTQLSFSQKDSIINYIGAKGKIIKNRDLALKKARFFEVLKKEEDSLWLVKKYRRDGKIVNRRYYKTSNKKHPIGQLISYNRNGSIATLTSYNNNGNKDGKIQSWFDNKNKNFLGFFKDGKKEGIWKFYHYNGELACKTVYKNDKVLKVQYFDELGNKVEEKKVLKSTQPKFRGGKRKFVEKLKKLTNQIDYKVKGRIFVNFIIDTKGEITEVEIDEDLPKTLEKQIKSFLENIKGWSPAIHNNRKMPFNFNLPLNFRK